MPSPKSIVCLTFDFDAISVWLARGMDSPTPVSRGEFGAVAADRLLALLDRLGLPSTWFIPGHTLASYPEHCRRIHEAGHEIGNHGWTHVAPNLLSREDELSGLVRANEAIRELTGRPARGYRSPSWDLSPHTLSLLLEQGFDYDSSMMGHDYLPYQVRQGDRFPLDEPAQFGPSTRLIEMPISWSLDDYPHFEFVRAGQSVLPGLMNANDVLENWVEDYLYLKENFDWGVITYTFHPFVIGRGHRMRMLERLLRRLIDEGATFMRMEDVVDLYQQRQAALAAKP
jgi:peptidoglycan/xylan/chitin deacetylase (PgdA/CDA1 family)